MESNVRSNLGDTRLGSDPKFKLERIYNQDDTRTCYDDRLGAVYGKNCLIIGQTDIIQIDNYDSDAIFVFKDNKMKERIIPVPVGTSYIRTYEALWFSSYFYSTKFICYLFEITSAIDIIGILTNPNVIIENKIGDKIICSIDGYICTSKILNTNPPRRFVGFLQENIDQTSDNFNRLYGKYGITLNTSRIYGAGNIEEWTKIMLGSI
jgi:hypothetical protein